MALSEEQNQYVLELLNLSGGSIKKAQDLFEKEFHFRLSRNTLLNRWEPLGYSQSRGGHRFGFSEGSFRELYKKYNGDITDMQKETKHSVSNLLEWCKRCDLEPRNVPIQSYTRYAPTDKFRLSLDDSV